MSADTSRPDDRVTGHRPGSGHLLAAAGASLGGLRRLLAETAFRHEMALLAAIVALFALVGAGRADYGIALVLWLGLVAAEALNTAIEMIVDRLSPEISEFARQTKDLGSLAVFCLIAANLGFAVAVVAAAAPDAVRRMEVVLETGRPSLGARVDASGAGAGDRVAAGVADRRERDDAVR